MLVSIVASLLAVELLLRVAYSIRDRIHPPVSYVVHDDDLGWRPTPDLSTEFSKAGYGEITYRSTRHGFRRFGDVGSAKTRLWAIGDSTTQAYHVPAGRAYFDVLADGENLRLEVFAVGAGGWGSLQQALVLEELVDQISPDIVLWQLCANDPINNDWLLESRSDEHNNHMLRPYLEDGRIVVRHPDGRWGWLASRSVLARRLLVARQSLRKRWGRPLEEQLHLGHPDLQRALATTREILRRAVRAAPDATFLAFMSPSPGQYGWDAQALAEICSIEGLRCIPDVSREVAAAERRGARIDGGDDPHWNALGHHIAGNAILAYLRRQVLASGDEVPEAVDALAPLQDAAGAAEALLGRPPQRPHGAQAQRPAALQ